MTIFADTLQGSMIPLDAIERIGPAIKKADRHGNTLHTVKLRGGDREVHMLEHQVERLNHLAIQLIPAAPGTNLIRYDHVDDDVWRTPVIAWALCADGMVRPVEPSGVYNDLVADEFGGFVEMPDGRIESVSEWADLASFSDAKEMATSLKAARKARS